MSKKSGSKTKKMSFSKWLKSPDMKKIQAAMKQWHDEITAQMAELDKNPPPLLHTKWVLSKVLQHLRESGSYRYLIYERLGYGMDAYAYLLDEGMAVSNHCVDYSVLRNKHGSPTREDIANDGLREVKKIKKTRRVVRAAD